MRNKLIERLLEKRNRPDAIKNVLKSERKRKEARQRSPSSKRRHPSDETVLKGVYRGNFFRLKLPVISSRKAAQQIPKIPTVAPPPNLQAIVADAAAAARSSGPSSSSIGNQLKEWMRENGLVLLLNFGSICTLMAFTRSDVLELRSLSATGSICNAIYHGSNQSFNWFNVLWPCVFASVNIYKIAGILEERNADVVLTDEQEQIYVEHFLPHGVTPKMFEILSHKADVLHIKKDSVIVRKGAPSNHVYLVASGSTSASILGRYLTAQSTSSQIREDPNRLHSGTWIGEMNFLDWAWEKNQRTLPSNKPVQMQEGTSSPVSPPASPSSSEEVSSKNVTVDALVANDSTATSTSKQTQPPKAPLNKALSESLYTIVAKEDCLVWRWSFEDMNTMMNRSTVRSTFFHWHDNILVLQSLT